MTHYITINDNDVLSMNDETGDIEVLRDKLPPRIDKGETVVIHFEEDPKTIQHQYTINSFDYHQPNVLLSWVKQLGESLLTEADDDEDSFYFDEEDDYIDSRTNSKKFRDKLSAAERKAQKAKEKVLKNAEKLIARDMSNKGVNWKFYLQDKNGKFPTFPKQPLTQNKVKPYYDKMKRTGSLTPDVANAIVLTEDEYYVRRGMQDLLSKNIDYRDIKPIVKPEFTLPWRTESDDEDEKPSDSMSAETSTKEETPETSSTETPDTVEVSDSKNDEKTTNSDNNNKDNARYNLGISSTTYAHFLKLLYYLKPKLYDAFDKPVDVSTIADIKKNIQYNNLGDYEIEINNEKVPAIKWIQKAVKDKVLMEKVLNETPVITLDDADLYDPEEVNLKNNLARAVAKEKAEAEAKAKEEQQAKFKEKYATVFDRVTKSISNNDKPSDTLQIFFNDLVPDSGNAETVAGELVRATMQLLYRDFNDGDKFFEGYGIETCGSSAEYLYDNGFAKQIRNIVYDAYRLSDDDNAYTASLENLTKDVIDYIMNNIELVYTANTEDSRDYPVEFIKENQPRYEFEIYGSDDVVKLVDEGIINAWDLNEFVENYLSYEHQFDGAEVSRPWSHTSTEVTIENLTKDGLDYLQDVFRRDPDGFWEDLVSEYTDDLAEINDSEYDDTIDEE